MLLEKFALSISAFLAFLFPVGFYCLVLATINRRRRPLLVSGAWDTVGLLFALSGFFLITVPMLLSEFFVRAAAAELPDQPSNLWAEQWLVDAAYFVVLVVGSALLIFWRGNLTLIYNV